MHLLNVANNHAYHPFTNIIIHSLATVSSVIPKRVGIILFSSWEASQVPATGLTAHWYPLSTGIVSCPDAIRTHGAFVRQLMRPIGGDISVQDPMTHNILSLFLYINWSSKIFTIVRTGWRLTTLNMPCYSLQHCLQKRRRKEKSFHPLSADICNSIFQSSINFAFSINDEPTMQCDHSCYQIVLFRSTLLTRRWMDPESSSTLLRAGLTAYLLWSAIDWRRALFQLLLYCSMSPRPSLLLSPPLLFRMRVNLLYQFDLFQDHVYTQLSWNITVIHKLIGLFDKKRTRKKLGLQVGGGIWKKKGRHA